MQQTLPAIAKHALGDILVVDDDEGVRRLATLTLKKAGFRVVAACDGEEGMAVIRDRGGDFDAVLLDMTMPGLSGAETCSLIRRLHPALPIVLTSGHAEQEAAVRVRADDITGFLQKPFTLATLVSTMQGAVRRRAQESA